MKDVIDCIPSKALRDYLNIHPLELSVLQEATIVSEYATRKKQIALFKKLADKTNSEAEKLLLNTAITDLQQHPDMESGYMKNTCEVYEKNFPHEGFPLFPFLEICNLPVLFKSGDVIRSNEWFHSDTYCVGIGPSLKEGRCDFSDECYLCYPVSYPARNQDDLALCHVHIDICEADTALTDTLTKKQKKNLNRIRELIASDNYELKYLR